MMKEEMKEKLPLQEGMDESILKEVHRIEETTEMIVIRAREVTGTDTSLETAETGM